jgi:hypothetical protein
MKVGAMPSTHGDVRKDNMGLKNVKEDEMVVKKDDFGWLVETWVKKLLDYNPYVADGEYGTDTKLRRFWPMLEDYYKRHIQTDIEVAIALDDPPRPNRQPLQNKELWIQFLKDFRPGKTAFTVDYHCHKCKAKGVKLWRGVHGCADKDGNELLCASCLAPDQKVSDKGKGKCGIKSLDDMETDQINGWLPAVPVDDTYWGYSSVPSQDVEWWVALPTYPKK